MLEVDGRLEALGCSGLAEKLIFERMPAGLADEPTLSMRIRVPDAGRYSIALSYLSLGLDWSADYIARIDPGGQTLDLEGWITLVNRSSTTFADAPTEVVAGTLSRDREETQPPEVTAVVQRANCWPMRGRSCSAKSRWPTFLTCSITRPPRASRPFASYLPSGRSWMAESDFTVAPLDMGHDRTAFDCGVRALNLYLRNYALQNQKKGIVRNYVTTRADSQVVVAYYSLVYAAIEQKRDAFARHELLALDEPRARLLGHRLHARLGLAELGDGGKHALAIAPVVGAAGIDLAFEDGHGFSRPAPWASWRGGSRCRVASDRSPAAPSSGRRR